MVTATVVNTFFFHHFVRALICIRNDIRCFYVFDFFDRHFRATDVSQGFDLRAMNPNEDNRAEWMVVRGFELYRCRNMVRETQTVIFLLSLSNKQAKHRTTLKTRIRRNNSENCVRFPLFLMLKLNLKIAFVLL